MEEGNSDEDGDLISNVMGKVQPYSPLYHNIWGIPLRQLCECEQHPRLLKTIKSCCTSTLGQVCDGYGGKGAPNNA
eukprot:1334520-Amorphochlora_amoeboformis.AAC.3